MGGVGRDINDCMLLVQAVQVVPALCVGAGEGADWCFRLPEKRL